MKTELIMEEREEGNSLNLYKIHRVYAWESYTWQTCDTTQETSYPQITMPGLFLTHTVEFMAMTSEYILWDHRRFCLDCKQGEKNLFELNIQIYNMRFKYMSIHICFWIL